MYERDYAYSRRFEGQEVGPLAQRVKKLNASLTFSVARLWM